MKRIVTLSESDLIKIVKRVIKESEDDMKLDCYSCIDEAVAKSGIRDVGVNETEHIKNILKNDKAPTVEDLKKLLPNSDDYWAMTKFVGYLSYCLAKC